MSKRLFVLVMISLTVAVMSVYAECTAATSLEIADKIAHGHAWVNHGNEFAEKKVIAGLALPETLKILTEEEFQTYIMSVITTTKSKLLPSAREVYWDSTAGVIIFYDPLSNDCGTAYRPNEGKQYYDRILTRNNGYKDRAKSESHKKMYAPKHDKPQQTIQPSSVNSFQCDGRVYCSQMHSCEEATYFLQNCPNVKMDGNHDGVACETQWCK